MPDDSYLVSDVVQAIEYGAEAADLDELGALLLLFGALDAPARGGGGGGCDGGYPEGVLGTSRLFFSSNELPSDLIGVDLSNHAPITSPAHHTTSCDLHEPHKIYFQTSVVGEFPSYQRNHACPTFPLGGGGGGIVVVVTAEVVDVDVGSREPDCDNVRLIVGVVIRGTEEVS
nr:hypothetical protein [Tanacetum cinerariifolium]